MVIVAGVPVYAMLASYLLTDQRFVLTLRSWTAQYVACGYDKPACLACVNACQQETSKCLPCTVSGT